MADLFGIRGRSSLAGRFGFVGASVAGTVAQLGWPVWDPDWSSLAGLLSFCCCQLSWQLGSAWLSGRVVLVDVWRFRCLEVPKEGTLGMEVLWAAVHHQLVQFSWLDEKNLVVTQSG